MCVSTRFAIMFCNYVLQLLLSVAMNAICFCFESFTKMLF
ncbi:hypothetical protein HMPREF1586_00904 [Gardnerella vaginalis JCP8522]|nr:hypothetical protein HMPREF1586_00904 [Gardnerella vaginalis JCP8522]